MEELGDVKESKPEKVVFVSNFPFLDLTMRAARQMANPWGGSYVDKGRHILFNNGKYETSNPEDIAFILQHEHFRIGNIKRLTAEESKVFNPEHRVKVVTGGIDSTNVPRQENVTPINTTREVKAVKLPRFKS